MSNIPQAMIDAARKNAKATRFIQRMTRRFTPSQTMKSSLGPCLGLSPATDSEQIALLCWLRANSLPYQQQSTYWLMPNWSYIYLLIGEYILEVPPPPLSAVADSLDIVWNDIKTNLKERTFAPEIAKIDVDTNFLTSKDKLVEALSCLRPLMTRIIGYNHQLDLDSALCVLAIAVSKRGTASESLCSRTQMELQRDNMLRADLTITSGIIKNVWELLGQYMDSDKLARMVVDSANVSVLRLRLLMQRVASSGLTAYRTITEMRLKHQKFPWAAIDAIYTNELSELRKIDEAISADPFLAYSGNANLHSVKKYANFYYLARQLKIVVDQDTMFSQYVAHAPTEDATSLDTLVNSYKEKYTKLN